MATLIGNKFGNSNVAGVDMPNWHLHELGAGRLTSFNDHRVTIQANDHTYVLTGHDFAFDVFGGEAKLGAGVITGLTVYPREPSVTAPPADFRISDFHMNVGRLLDFIANADKQGFERALFSGDDLVRGGASIDTLFGWAGNDVMAGGDGDDFLRGGRGDDLLQGDRGVDVLHGGAGADCFIFNDVEDSCGGLYDTIDRFNVNRDHIAVSNTIAAIDPAVDAGASATWNVDPALAMALDAAHLGIDHAVVVTVDVGPIAGQGPTFHETFLVIDANGIAGYQGGGDIAIHIANPKGLNHLSIDDFLLTS